jgi:hypothetical protein
VKVHLVVFFAEFGTTTSLVGSVSGERQIELLYRSAMCAGHDVALTILTNTTTDLSAIPVPFNRLDAPFGPNGLMLSKTELQLRFLEAWDFSVPVLFLDSDILIAADLSDLVTADFDIGLTVRASDEMPINAGVVVVNTRRPDAVLAFARRMIARIHEQTVGLVKWYGDQIALVDVVGLPVDALLRLDTHESDGVTFKFLPCDVYNCTPPNSNAVLDRLPEGAKLLHFKGNRRPMMEAVWRRHLAADRTPPGALRRATDWLVLAGTRYLYNRGLRQQTMRRFEGRRTSARAWRDWSRIAAMFCARVPRRDGQPLRITAVVSGGVELPRYIETATAPVDVQLVDLSLAPQSAEEVELVAAAASDRDVLVLLGVIEAVGDVAATLRAVAAPWLVIAHTARDLTRLKPRQYRRLGWRSCLTTAEFDAALASAGFGVVERHLAEDGRAMLWLCRRS